ncbi:MAG: N-acetylmuramic acid 6-phosphate etherase [bacterium]|nr:N-acetylmuramic acid 6-phosphate etherase [bacterium]
MLDRLETEAPNPASEGIDGRPTEEILRVINAEDRRVAEAVEAEISQITTAVDRVVDCLRAGGRLFYIGAGTSGRLGVLDASECKPTFQVPEELVRGIIAGGEAALSRPTEASEDVAATGAQDLESRGFTGNDVLVGITASGRTPYVLGAVEAARRMGAVTIGVSANPDTELSRAVDVSIAPRTGPEVIAGSTRMKAGTAAKLVLNMISTAAMIRLGHVYGNLMVNVQPVNSKLADRARRIVEQAAAVDSETAARLLGEADGNVRVAILMARRGASVQEAQQLLEAAAGRISEALRDG